MNTEKYVVECSVCAAVAAYLRYGPTTSEFERGRLAERERVTRITRALRDRDCPYLGNYKLGYDSALDDLVEELGAVALGVEDTKTAVNEGGA